MQLTYAGAPLGNANSAQFTWGRSLRRNAAGVGYGLDWSVRCPSVRLTVAGPAEADAAILGVQSALAGQVGDLVFRHGDGAPSGKSVGDAATFSGVRCVDGPTWSDRAGAQHVTFLEFACAFEWTTLFANPADFLLDFTESVTTEGGEPFAVVLEPINVASPELQVTVPQQGYTAIQEGVSVGLSQYVVPDPIAGLGTLVKRRVRRVGPRRVGRGKEAYTVQYTYLFVSATAPAGLPTEWST